jgi:hypothetical protein
VRSRQGIQSASLERSSRRGSLLEMDTKQPTIKNGLDFRNSRYSEDHNKAEEQSLFEGENPESG